MSEFDVPFKTEIPINPSKKHFSKELQKEIQLYIAQHNPLLSEIVARAVYVKINDARNMTENIQNGSLDANLYAQMLVAITFTEGISSWSVQEIIGQINAKSSQTIYNSPATHVEYVNNQLKRYSIFDEDIESLKDIPIKAISQFPSKKNKSKNVLDFFGQHAIFSVTKSLLGHATVNDIMQPLLETHSVDESLQLLIKNPPESFHELYDPESQVERLSQI